jgi:hypothetical protein
VSLRALSKRYRVGARREPVFINRESLLAVRSNQDQNVPRAIDTPPEELLFAMWSAVPDVQMNGTLLVVPAGSLDSQIETQPDAHIFVSSSAEWDRNLEDIPRIDELPG